MKVSINWLKDYIPLKASPEELAKHLLHIGFEVSEITRLGPAFTGVVIGEVRKVQRHPNADRLRVCEVSDGTETFNVVCGAPNVAAGQRVPFARVGAKLPGGFKIKKSKIRGALSQGMICSDSELGLAENGEKSDGIKVLEPGSEIGTDYGASLGGADTVLEVDITPNRPDCLSHLGLARELSIYYRLPLTDAAKPLETGPADGTASLPIEIAERSECPRYRGRTIEGVTVGPSPSWLAKRLEAVGLRPINNIVDITNYVLMDTGQPLHVFDLDKLEGKRIGVRFAKEGEEIAALDGKSYALTPENLVIADAARPVAVAGVIGGEETGVSETTRRVFVECAHFRTGRIRRSARTLNIRTDSSYRFERGVDIEGVPHAAERATRLILELCGGKAGEPSDDHAGSSAPPGIAVTPERINGILGADYPAERVADVLKRLSSRHEESGGKLLLYPPSYRRDLRNRWDLAEEVARHLGYGAVPVSSSPVSIPPSDPPPLLGVESGLRAGLVELGFLEAYNYDFVSQAEVDRFYGAAPPVEPVPLLNPLSKDWAFLRPSLLIGLLRNATLNINRGAKALRLFEIGRAYRKTQSGVGESTCITGLLTGDAAGRAHWQRALKPADFFEVKGLVETLLRGLRFEWTAPEEEDGIFHPNASMDLRVGKTVFGRAGFLHPVLLRGWDLPAEEPMAAFELRADLLPRAKRARFKPFSVFPAVTRDISLVAAEGTPYADIEKSLRGRKIAELIRIDLIDLFTGESVAAGKKSLTLRLTFSRSDRTLKEAEVQAAVDKLLAALSADCGARLRS